MLVNALFLNSWQAHIVLLCQSFFTGLSSACNYLILKYVCIIKADMFWKLPCDLGVSVFPIFPLTSVAWPFHVQKTAMAMGILLRTHHRAAKDRPQRQGWILPPLDGASRSSTLWIL